ncbi:toll/interleukin-1 receptor domain-containing protein [Sphingobium sp. HWE2-09]|uniref:toll/interleukin-1 receptor domain-containing protein n=1 Tax=Sphingobium sp. HWE2-09 TaxID=3108390 RepID=UPI002DCD3486|nr:toll/interleukin-1 receptor domain-containing protein [Sphingobium sp. HWE2-09]
MTERTRKVSQTAKPKSAPARRPATAASKGKPPSGKPEVRIFVSYSHKDEIAQQKLKTHLAPWRRDGVRVWTDNDMAAGASLGTDIARELRQAHIFVALFSPSYLDSNYCWNIEYRRAMGRRARKLMRVVAVIVKPCSWKHTSAAGFKLLPKDGVPPESWSSHDAAYVDAARGIGDLIATVRRELASPSKKRGASGISKAKAVQPSPAPALKRPPNAQAKAKPRRAPPRVSGSKS